MYFFDQILVREKSTGNLIDITDLNKEQYEEFLRCALLLNTAYSKVKELNSHD